MEQFQKLWSTSGRESSRVQGRDVVRENSTIVQQQNSAVAAQCYRNLMLCHSAAVINTYLYIGCSTIPGKVVHSFSTYTARIQNCGTVPLCVGLSGRCQFLYQLRHIYTFSLEAILNCKN